MIERFVSGLAVYSFAASLQDELDLEQDPTLIETPSVVVMPPSASHDSPEEHTDSSKRPPPPYEM